MQHLSSGGIDFSIIIPTRNRPAQLEACLKSLASLDYPRPGFEVVVVDDGGTVPIEPVIVSCAGKIHVTLRKQPPSGPAAARNHGAEIARGSYLVFTDDDCTAARDWLNKLAAWLDRAPDRLVGGRTVNALGDNVFATATQVLLSYLYDYYNRDPARARFLASCNLVVPAGMYRDLGGFNPAYPRAAAEDRDLCDRALFSGFRIAYASDAVVFHRHALRMPTFWKQHFGYGRGAYSFQRARRERCGEGTRFEPLGFYLNMVCYPFRSEEVRRPFLVSALLLVSQIANAAGFFWECVLGRTGGTGMAAVDRNISGVRSLSQLQSGATERDWHGADSSGSSSPK